MTGQFKALHVYQAPGTIAGSGAGKRERAIRHRACCIHILQHSWKLMSFATSQSLMNSSPSALKQPEALQERQAGAGGEKGGDPGVAPSL